MILQNIISIDKFKFNALKFIRARENPVFAIYNSDCVKSLKAKFHPPKQM